MKRLFMRLVRLSVVPALFVLGIYTGGPDGLIGWLVLGWMIFRAGPGMWRDVRGGFGLLRGIRLGGRRGSHVGGLNV